MMPINVLLIEDHPLYAKGLQDYFAESAPDIQITRHARTLRAAQTEIQEHRFDALLVDLSLPDGRGEDFVRAYRQQSGNGVPILILSMKSADKFGPIVREAGAQGYVAKNAEPKYIADSLRAIMRGETRFADRAPGAPTSDPASALTPKQFAVFEKIGRGCSVGEAAEILGISTETAKRHQQDAADTMGVQGARALQRLAVEYFRDL